MNPIILTPAEARARSVELANDRDMRHLARPLRDAANATAFDGKTRDTGGYRIVADGEEALVRHTRRRLEDMFATMTDRGVTVKVNGYRDRGYTVNVLNDLDADPADHRARADAFLIAGRILAEFDADHEAGWPAVAVEPFDPTNPSVGCIVAVTWNRGRPTYQHSKLTPDAATPT